MQFVYPDLMIGKFKVGDIISVSPTYPGDFYPFVRKDTEEYNILQAEITQLQYKFTPLDDRLKSLEEKRANGGLIDAEWSEKRKVEAIHTRIKTQLSMKVNRRSWIDFIMNHPEYQDDNAKNLWESQRLTCKIIKSGSYYDKTELQVLWSNITEIQDEQKLTFKCTRSSEMIYRRPTEINLPEDDAAPVSAYKVFRDKRPVKELYDGQFHTWPHNPVLSMGDGVNSNQCLYPNEMVCDDDVLKEYCKSFFNKWTFVYKVQGKLIDYIVRLARNFNGQCASDYRENGFFTIALQRDNILSEGNDLNATVPQNIVWSHEKDVWGTVANFAYFPFSGLQADDLDNLRRGQLLSSTNSNISQIICFRKRIDRVNDDTYRGIPVKRYIFTVDKSVIHGPNPGITIERYGGNGWLRDEHNKMVNEPLGHYTFVRRGVQTFILNQFNSELRSDWMQTKAQMENIVTTKLFNKHGLSDIDRTEYMLNDDDIPRTAWHGTYFVEHEPRKVVIILPTDNGVKKIFKTIYRASEYIQKWMRFKKEHLLNNLLMMQIFTKKATESLAPGICKEGLERKFFKYISELETAAYEDSVNYAYFTHDHKKEIVDEFLKRLTHNNIEIEDWVQQIDGDDKIMQAAWNQRLNQDGGYYWPNEGKIMIDLIQGIIRRRIDLFTSTKSGEDALTTYSFETITYTKNLKTKKEDVIDKKSWADVDINGDLIVLNFIKRLDYRQYGLPLTDRMGGDKLYTFTMGKTFVINENYDDFEKSLGVAEKNLTLLENIKTGFKRILNGSEMDFLYFDDIAYTLCQTAGIGIKEKLLRQHFIEFLNDEKGQNFNLRKKFAVGIEYKKNDVVYWYDKKKGKHFISKARADFTLELGKQCDYRRYEDGEVIEPRDILPILSGTTWWPLDITKKTGLEFMRSKMLLSMDIHSNATIGDLLYHVITKKFIEELEEIPEDIETLQDLQKYVYAIDLCFTDDELNKKYIQQKNTALTTGGISIPSEKLEEYSANLQTRILMTNLNVSMLATTLEDFLRKKGFWALEERNNTDPNFYKFTVSILFEPKTSRQNAPISIEAKLSGGVYKSPIKQIPMVFDSQMKSMAGIKLNAKVFKESKNGIFIQGWVNYKNILPPPTNVNDTYKDPDSYALPVIPYVPDLGALENIDIKCGGTDDGHIAIRKNREEIILELFIRIKKVFDFEHDVIYGDVTMQNNQQLRQWLSDEWKNFKTKQDPRAMDLGHPIINAPTFLPFPFAPEIGDNVAFKKFWYDISLVNAMEEIRKENYGKVGAALEMLYKSRAFRIINLMNDMFSNGIPMEDGTRRILDTMDKYLIIQKYQSMFIQQDELKAGEVLHQGIPWYVGKNDYVQLSFHEKKEKRKRTSNILRYDWNIVVGAQENTFIKQDNGNSSALIGFGNNFQPEWWMLNSHFFTGLMPQWFSLVGSRCCGNPGWVEQTLQQTGIINVLSKILNLKTNILTVSVKEKVKQNIMPDEKIIAKCGLQTVVQILCTVYEHAFSSKTHLELEGKNKSVELNLRGHWLKNKKCLLFSKVEMFIQGKNIILYENGKHNTQILYQSGLKEANDAKTLFARYPVRFIFYSKERVINDFQKEIGADTVIRSRGMLADNEGYYVNNGVRPSDYITKENMYEQTPLITPEMANLMENVHFLNRKRKIDRGGILKELKEAPVYGTDGKQLLDDNGKPKWTAVAIDEVEEYKYFGLMDKIEHLTCELAILANSQRENTIQGLNRHEAGNKYTPDEIDKILGFEDTTCVICQKLGATVYMPNCPVKEKHVAHVTCLYNQGIRDTGLKNKSSKYFMINLNSTMMQVTTKQNDYGEISAEVKHSDLTIREFLEKRQEYFKDGRNKEIRETTAYTTIPLHHEQAVPINIENSGPIGTKYFLKEDKTNATGYANREHYEKDPKWQHLECFRCREILSGEVYQNGSYGPEAKEMEGRKYHSILHTWTEASKCPVCTTQIGGHLWVSTPCDIYEPAEMAGPMYAGRQVEPYDRNKPAHFGIMSPVMNLNFNFDEYRYDTLLYNMQPFGRAEVMATSEDEEENFGMGSLELYTGLDNYIQIVSQKEPQYNVPKQLKPQKKIKRLAGLAGGEDNRRLKQRTSTEDLGKIEIKSMLGWDVETEIKHFWSQGNGRLCAYELEIEHGDDENEIIELDFMGEITQKKKENLIKWIEAAYNKVYGGQKQNVADALKEQKAARDALYEKYGNVEAYQQIERKWKCRFTPVGCRLKNITKLDEDKNEITMPWLPILPPDINLYDFKTIIEENTSFPIENKFISVQIPSNWDGRKPIPKSDDYECWPQYVSVDKLKRMGARRGSTILVEMYEDVEACSPEEKLIKQRVRTRLSTVILYKIEYMGKRTGSGHPVLYDGVQDDEDTLKLRLDEPIAKILYEMGVDKFEESTFPLVTDKLLYPNISVQEMFMIRYKNKKQIINSKRFKILFEFVEGGEDDEGEDNHKIIPVNKAPMVIDCPYGVDIGDIKKYIRAADWFKTKSCWLHQTDSGVAGLPDGRPLFDLNVIYDDDSFFSDFYKDKALIIETFRENKVLCMRDFEVDERVFPHTEGTTWTDLFYTEDRQLLDDEDREGRPGDFLTEIEDTSEGDKLEIVNPWYISQYTSSQHMAPISTFESGSASKYLKIKIPIPKATKYEKETNKPKYAKTVSRCKKYMSEIEKETGFTTEIIMVNVQYIDRYTDGKIEKRHNRMPIPGIFFLDSEWRKDELFRWMRKYFNTLNYDYTNADGDEIEFTSERFGAASYIPPVSEVEDKKELLEWMDEQGFDLVAVKARLNKEGENIDKVIYADISTQNRSFMFPEEIMETITPEQLQILFPRMEILNAGLDWGPLDPNMIMQRGINIELAESTEKQRQFIATALHLENKLDVINHRALELRNGDVAGRKDDSTIISPGFQTSTDVLVSRDQDNFQSSHIIEEMECATNTFKTRNLNDKLLNNEEYEEFLKSDSTINLTVYRNLAFTAAEADDWQKTGADDLATFSRLADKRTCGLSRPIQFQFVDCSDPEKKLNMSNPYKLTGSAIHEYFLPENFGSTFGFNDLQWTGLFPSLINVFIAEIIYSRKDINHLEDNHRIYTVEEYDVEKDEWKTSTKSDADLIQEIKKHILYVGTTMIRDNANKYRWAHLPNGWNFQVKDEHQVLKEFHKFNQDTEGLKPGTGESLSLETARSVYMDNTDLPAVINEDEDEYGDANTNFLPRASLWCYREAKKHEDEEGHNELEDRNRKLSYLSAKQWTDDVDKQDIYISSYLGIDPKTLTRGISLNGQGYNIQEALFGVEGTMDANNNLYTGSEWVPRFNIGITFNKNTIRLKKNTFKIPQNQYKGTITEHGTKYLNSGDKPEIGDLVLVDKHKDADGNDIYGIVSGCTNLVTIVYFAERDTKYIWAKNGEDSFSKAFGLKARTAKVFNPITSKSEYMPSDCILIRRGLKYPGRNMDGTYIDGPDKGTQIRIGDMVGDIIKGYQEEGFKQPKRFKVVMTNPMLPETDFTVIPSRPLNPEAVMVIHQNGEGEIKTNVYGNDFILLNRTNLVKLMRISIDEIFSSDSDDEKSSSDDLSSVDSSLLSDLINNLKLTF